MRDSWEREKQLLHGKPRNHNAPKHKDKTWKKRILPFFPLYPLLSQLLRDCWRGKARAEAGGTIAPLTAAPQPDISELWSPGVRESWSCCSRSGASTSLFPCLFPALVFVCLLTCRMCIRACQWMAAGFTLTSSS